jgi:putative Ig domain-containing protein
VTVSCPASVVGTGAPLTPCTATASGAAMAPVDVTASLVYANNVVGPTATAAASWAGDVNHTGSTGSGSFVITAPAPPPPPPPVVNPIAPILDQLNAEGDKVEIQIQVAGFSGKHDDDDRFEDAHARFGAANLPSGLEMEKEKGIIRGRIKKGAAAASPYQVIVLLTVDGVTYSRNFTWTITK